MCDSEFEAERNAVFDSAKRASDFVGMIVRLAFLQFASFYFLGEVPEKRFTPAVDAGSKGPLVSAARSISDA
ncbi:hypothetical protein [Devosia psychrophila]|uniref:Uncharacterized protein n=1 Tax=Devosia psychrophila TaxID=728005 RepID=A0A0F5PUF7_9HYPH|nr:hypothetical protein [Devosia psychrophila]KKC31454.1 hypothetical protein WH91_19680 [Devosia psychrophila]SFC95240.1 hypothetical protein SAMN04488059_11587 [Devosia psychrophila]